jgi:uncharacterized DUF497 family protein
MKIIFGTEGSDKSRMKVDTGFVKTLDCNYNWSYNGNAVRVGRGEEQAEHQEARLRPFRRSGSLSGNDPLFVSPDVSEDYGEERWKGIGVLREVIVVVVVFTERNSGTIRIISLRKASSRERKAYEEEIRNRLGAG